jgi:hypothetical protein
VWVHRTQFITPMAAVAGSVADEMLQAMLLGRTLDKAYVNDGGDIAIHLAPGQSLRAGIFVQALDGAVTLTHDSLVRGLATSGWGGRSFSLGIADSVTVLASTAAMADAAATVVANAVNADHPAIERQPAVSLDPDSDLGELAVTVDVGDLPAEIVSQALDRGLAKARELRQRGLIHGAALNLKGEWRIEAQASCLTTSANRTFSRTSVRYIVPLKVSRSRSTTSPEWRVRLSTLQATTPAMLSPGLSRSRTAMKVSTSCATPCSASTWVSTGTISSRAAARPFNVKMPRVGGVSIST